MINKDSKNTKKQTESTFNILLAYCNEKCIPVNPEIIFQSEFNKLLCKFYAEARRADGVMYKKNSFYAIRFGTQRRMKAIRGHDFDVSAASKKFRLRKVVRFLIPARLTFKNNLKTYLKVNHN